jgi:hypothetical protein
MQRNEYYHDHWRFICRKVTLTWRKGDLLFINNFLDNIYPTRILQFPIKNKTDQDEDNGECSITRILTK